MIFLRAYVHSLHYCEIYVYLYVYKVLKAGAPKKAGTYGANIIAVVSYKLRARACMPNLAKFGLAPSLEGM